MKYIAVNTLIGLSNNENLLGVENTYCKDAKTDKYICERSQK